MDDFDIRGEVDIDLFDSINKVVKQRQISLIQRVKLSDEIKKYNSSMSRTYVKIMQDTDICTKYGVTLRVETDKMLMTDIIHISGILPNVHDRVKDKVRDKKGKMFNEHIKTEVTFTTRSLFRIFKESCKLTHEERREFIISYINDIRLCIRYNKMLSKKSIYNEGGLCYHHFNFNTSFDKF